MKKIILLFALFTLFIFLSHKSFAQHNISWYGELHAGWQATLNSYPYSAQIKQGLEDKPFDSSKHYAAYFKNQVPVEATFGMNNKKGFQCQLSVAYYSMKIALSNPPGVSGNEEYLLGDAHILSVKVHALMDYSALNGNDKNKWHFIAGVYTGFIMPACLQMDATTTKHFGISAFQKNIVWTAGLELVLNIDISKRLYVANNFAFDFPVSGNLGQIQMQSSSSYFAGNPVKINSIHINSGIGIRF